MKNYSNIYLDFMLDLNDRSGDIIKETKQWYIIRYKLINRKYIIVKVRKNLFPNNTYYITLKLRKIFEAVNNSKKLLK